ncbi:CPCC family cysteine-rich protein [Xenorhabdus szentirmaii]|uniref:CPCC family cysteine-rich protein n=1 Tax=Xenorhabdus szentirmaii TaxID=290112 RepID=UPI0032B73C85
MIKDITGNKITIIDHQENLITRVHCPACYYIVFENKDDEFYEICPVCQWQNDDSDGDNYSIYNHSTLNEYKETDYFKHRLIDIYEIGHLPCGWNGQLIIY